ncbi:MAG: hypothetical protein ABOK23_10575 [Candidatus Methanoperedens sp.]|nr:hypothetical protein [Candidatus Methanoperedens sp.]MCZ7394222.1 hypothetical protein [Candidatus Methanoperedens sp.]
MEEGIIKTAPDREKAKSILKMVETTLEMIDTIDPKKFTSHVVKEYYEVIRELITVILLLDGYKTQGEGAHKKLIEYMKKNYAEFRGHEISLIDDLRVIRNKIAYNGFFVTDDYLDRRRQEILTLIDKLRIIIYKKL